MNDVLKVFGSEIIKNRQYKITWGKPSFFFHDIYIFHWSVWVIVPIAVLFVALFLFWVEVFSWLVYHINVPATDGKDFNHAQVLWQGRKIRLVQLGQVAVFSQAFVKLDGQIIWKVNCWELLWFGSQEDVLGIFIELEWTFRVVCTCVKLSFASRLETLGDAFVKSGWIDEFNQGQDKDCFDDWAWPDAHFFRIIWFKSILC